MAKYNIVFEGKVVDTLTTRLAAPSSVLQDYASNNHHIKKQLGKRVVIGVELGELKNGEATVTVEAGIPGEVYAKPSSAPIGVASTPLNIALVTK